MRSRSVKQYQEQFSLHSFMVIGQRTPEFLRGERQMQCALFFSLFNNCQTQQMLVSDYRASYIGSIGQYVLVNP